MEIDPKCRVCSTVAPEYALSMCEEGCLVCEGCMCQECDHCNMCQICCENVKDDSS